MRLGIVGPAAPYRGGIAHYTTSLFHAVSARFPCTVISFARQYPSWLFPGKTQEDLASGALDPVGERILDPISPRSWRKAISRLRAFEVDTVLYQWWQPFFGLAYSSMMSQLGKPPVSIVLCHNVLPHESRPWPISAIERNWTHRAFRGASAFLVHSESLERQLRGVRSDALVERIYHPVYEFLGERPVAPREEGPIRILFFGKVRRYKGLEVLLEALNLLEDRLEFEAVIAGEFYLPEAGFRNLLSDWAASRVEWINEYIPNARVGELFGAADVLVLPYLEASQSGIVPQAYQFDLPVIASDVGGLSEVVIPGKTGDLFPPRRPDLLAERLVEFARQRHSTDFVTSIREFRSRLSWDQVVDKIYLFASSLA